MFIRLLDSYTQTQSSPTPRLLKDSLGKLSINQKEVVFSAKWTAILGDNILKKFKTKRDLFLIQTIEENAIAFQFPINLFR